MNFDPNINRSSFFPRSKDASAKKSIENSAIMKRNSYEKASELKNITRKDAKVDIPSAVKDFARIKRAVDLAPDIDNSAKIENLKQRIASGKYNIDYDAIADKMLQNEY